MFFLTPRVYVERDEMFDITSSREFGFVDSKFNKVIFDPNNFRIPLFNCASFDEIKEELVTDKKVVLYVNDELYWNIVYTILTHLVTVLFKVDESCVTELYESYRLKHFSRVGDVAPSIETRTSVKIPTFLLPESYSDCAFELLVFFAKQSGNVFIDEHFGKKVTSIMEKWMVDRAHSIVTSLIKNYDLFNKQEDELFFISSFLIKGQPITRKQYRLIFDAYCNFCGVAAYPSLETEMNFLIKYLNGEVSVVDCFNFLSDNKIKAFSYERNKVNEWVLYKCFVKKS